jgi:hypothetical protein
LKRLNPSIGDLCWDVHKFISSADYSNWAAFDFDWVACDFDWVGSEFIWVDIDFISVEET